MADPLDPIDLLAERFRRAIGAAFADAPAARDADPLITPSRNPQFGDYQSNAAMPLGKALGRPPREVARAIVAALDVTGIAEPLTEGSIAGPGFINVRLSAGALAGLLERLDSPALGVEGPAAGARQTVVVDLCGVNLAKQMHVGHLRSIIIGDAIARALSRLGHGVIRQNHVGDWGLPIAMVTARLMRELAEGRLRSLDGLTLDDLERLYRRAQRECEADERGLEAARRWGAHPKAMAELEAQVGGAAEELARAQAVLLRLQNHDAEAVAVWKRIADITMAECLRTCRRLHADIDEDDSAGESSYAGELAGIVEDLLRRGVAEVSEGAVIVRVEGIEEPCIIRKSERGGGGFLYATTDLAAIRRRVQSLGADRVIYCVDARQSLHFRQVFGAAVRASYATRPGAGAPARLEHAAFGMVLGPDGRPFKTRSGENVKLSDLIDEGVERAERAVRAKNPDLAPGEARAIAETIGVAAIKYADLASDRARDYVFDFERMLAFEGNTGPYLLYAQVRTRKILEKAGAAMGAEAARAAAASARFDLRAKEEKDLALALLRYPAAVRAVGETLEPHRLCQYLYDAAVAFSAFYDRCHVLEAPDEATRASRLRLCRLTGRVLADGLGLLGIQVLERM
jgi:arginyl-tRNA synthetase